jgi:hypothetical protein
MLTAFSRKDVKHVLLELTVQKLQIGDGNLQIRRRITIQLNFRHRASCILGQAFRCTPENAFCIFNEQIYFII